MPPSGLRLAAAGVLCIVLVGCGAERSDAPADAPSTAAESADVTRYEAWSAAMAEPDLVEPVTLVNELAVFARPATPDDAFPSSFGGLAGDTAEGREIAGRSRLLISGVATENIDELGPQRLSLYGVPTDRGWVCPYVVYEELGDFADGMSGACEHGLIHGFGLELHGVGPSYRLYGLVANGIERVSLRVGEQLLPARVESNGLYFGGDATDICPIDIEALVVQRADGSADEVAWSELAPDIVDGSRDTFGCD